MELIKKIIIPVYQRPYNWKRANCEKLLLIEYKGYEIVLNVMFLDIKKQ